MFAAPQKDKDDLERDDRRRMEHRADYVQQWDRNILSVVVLLLVAYLLYKQTDSYHFAATDAHLSEAHFLQTPSPPGTPSPDLSLIGGQDATIERIQEGEALPHRVLQRSLVVGSSARLRQALRKLQRDEGLKVAIAGGELAAISDKPCDDVSTNCLNAFMTHFMEWVDHVWPHSDHSLVNCPLPAGDTRPMIRCLEEQQQLDIVFLELNAPHQAPADVEETLRAVLGSNPGAEPPAVVVLHAFRWDLQDLRYKRQAADESLEMWSILARVYDVSVVSSHNALMPEVMGVNPAFLPFSSWTRDGFMPTTDKDQPPPPARFLHAPFAYMAWITLMLEYFIQASVEDVKRFPVLAEGDQQSYMLPNYVFDASATLSTPSGPQAATTTPAYYTEEASKPSPASTPTSAPTSAPVPIVSEPTAGAAPALPTISPTSVSLSASAEPEPALPAESTGSAAAAAPYVILPDGGASAPTFMGALAPTNAPPRSRWIGPGAPAGAAPAPTLAASAAAAAAAPAAPAASFARAEPPPPPTPPLTTRVLDPVLQTCAKDGSVALMAAHTANVPVCKMAASNLADRGMGWITVAKTSWECQELVSEMEDSPCCIVDAWGPRDDPEMVSLRRWTYAHLALQLGYDVILQDCEVLWSTNPLEALRNKTEVLVTALPEESPNVAFHAGLMFVRHHNATVGMAEEINKRVEVFSTAADQHQTAALTALGVNITKCPKHSAKLATMHYPPALINDVLDTISRGRPYYSRAVFTCAPDGRKDMRNDMAWAQRSSRVPNRCINLGLKVGSGAQLACLALDVPGTTMATWGTGSTRIAGMYAPWNMTAPVARGFHFGGVPGGPFHIVALMKQVLSAGTHGSDEWLRKLVETDETEVMLAVGSRKLAQAPPPPDAPPPPFELVYLNHSRWDAAEPVPPALAAQYQACAVDGSVNVFSCSEGYTHMCGAAVKSLTAAGMGFLAVTDQQSVCDRLPGGDRCCVVDPWDAVFGRGFEQWTDQVMYCLRWKYAEIGLKLGYEVMLQDCDVVWTGNPVARLRAEGAAAAVTGLRETETVFAFNGGLLYLRPLDAALALAREMAARTRFFAAAFRDPALLPQLGIDPAQCAAAGKEAIRATLFFDQALLNDILETLARHAAVYSRSRFTCDHDGRKSILGLHALPWLPGSDCVRLNAKGETACLAADKPGTLFAAWSFGSENVAGMHVQWNMTNNPVAMGYHFVGLPTGSGLDYKMAQMNKTLSSR